MATQEFKVGGYMNREIVKFSIRMDENLKTRIELLAKKNNLNFTKMLNYIVEIGYQTYITRFDKYYEEQNKKLKDEGERYE